MNWVTVADHETATLQDAGKILCRQMMRVTGFKSFRALKDFLSENKPDLILLGSFPDEPGGLEAAALLKEAMKPDGEIPVILVTDEEDPGFEERALSEGIAGLITRPLDSSVLTALVQRAFSSQRSSGTQEDVPMGNTLDEIASILEEWNDTESSIWLGREAFENVYRHILRNMQRSQGSSFQVLFTLEMPKNTDAAHRSEILGQFRSLLQNTLRSSDMLLESGENQFFLLLPEMPADRIGPLLSDVIGRWKQTEHGRGCGKAEHHQNDAHDCENRDGVAGRDPHVLPAPCTIDLRNNDRGSGRDGDEEPDENVDDLSRAASNPGKCDSSDKAADDQTVDGVI